MSKASIFNPFSQRVLQPRRQTGPLTRSAEPSLCRLLETQEKPERLFYACDITTTLHQYSFLVVLRSLHYICCREIPIISTQNIQNCKEPCYNKFFVRICSTFIKLYFPLLQLIAFWMKFVFNFLERGPIFMHFLQQRDIKA